jgi:hypothetical protein
MGRVSYPHGWLRLVSSTALRISRVTASGCDTMDACEAATSSIRAFPRYGKLPEPWAGGGRWMFLQLRYEQVSGGGWSVTAGEP